MRAALVVLGTSLLLTACGAKSGLLLGGSLPSDDDDDGAVSLDSGPSPAPDAGADAGGVLTRLSRRGLTLTPPGDPNRRQRRFRSP